MNKEEKKSIITEFNKSITHIARGSGFFINEIKELLAEEFVKEDDYTIVEWPDIQYLMDKIDFKENACLINDEYFLNIYGSSAYFVNKKWLKSLK